MPTTSWKYPGSSGQSLFSGEIGTDTAWGNLANVTADDAVEASCGGVAGNYTRTLRLKGFGFTSSDIPTGSTILGIEVEIKWRADHNGRANEQLVKLISADTGSTADRVGNSKATGTSFTTTAAYSATKGGAADMWGTSLTQGQITGAGFGLDIIGVFGLTTQMYVDTARIRVTYSTPISGSANITLDAVTPAATGAVRVQGASFMTMNGVSVAATAAEIVKGDLGGTLGAIVAQGQGQAFVKGVASITIGAVTVVGTVVLDPPRAATLNATLGAVTSGPIDLITFGDDYTNAAWSKSGAVPTADQATDPDGLLRADLITWPSSGYPSVFRSVATPSGVLHTLITRAKAGTRSQITTELRGATGSVYDALFDLSAGTVTVNPAAVGSPKAAIVSLGSGWYACAIAKVTTNTAPIAIVGDQNTTNGQTVYLGRTSMFAGEMSDALVRVQGTLTATLGAVSIAATGIAPLKGTSSVTLANVGVAATGVAPLKGTSSPTLGSIIAQGTGTVDVQGTASITLGSVTPTATAVAPLKATSSLTLGAITIAASGNPLVKGTASATLAAVDISATAAAPVKGTLSIALGAVTPQSGAKAYIKGALSGSLDALGFMAAGRVGVPAEIPDERRITLHGSLFADRTIQLGG